MVTKEDRKVVESRKLSLLGSSVWVLEVVAGVKDPWEVPERKLGPSCELDPRTGSQEVHTQPPLGANVSRDGGTSTVAKSPPYRDQLVEFELYLHLDLCHN